MFTASPDQWQRAGSDSAGDEQNRVRHPAIPEAQTSTLPFTRSSLHLGTNSKMPVSKTKLEQAEAEAAPEPNGTFKLIYDHCVLGTIKPGDSPSKILQGSVARLKSGDVYCRVACTDADGTTVYGYDRFELDPMLRIGDPNPVPTFVAKEFQKDVERWEPYCLTQFTPPDYSAEAAKFEKTWRSIYPTFDLLRDFPAPLFAPGVVRYPRTPNDPYKFDHNWIIGRLFEHTTGNFGLLGKADVTTPFDSEETWSEGILERSRRNSLAIMRGDGEVVSHFLLREFEQSVWKKHRIWQNDFAALQIKTLLRPNGNSQTLIFVVESKG
jgi:hypothetical protein